MTAQTSENDSETLPLTTLALEVALGLGSSESEVLFALGELLAREATASLAESLGQLVDVGDPTIETVDLRELEGDTWSGHLVVDLRLELDSGATGSSVILLPQDEVQALLPSADGDGPNLEVFSDLVHGLVARLSEQLAGQYEPSLRIAVTEADATDELAETDGAMVRIKHRLSIGDQTFRADHLLSSSVLADLAMGSLPELTSEPAAQEAPAPVEASVAPLSPQTPPVGGTAVHPAEFAPLEPEGKTQSSTNLDLLLGVPLRVTVELGRRQMTIQEVLELGPGSVIELNRIAGEPVDILVNNQFIARGEVVVVDENFGVRVTEIVSPARRLSPQMASANS